jgi:uncharacterized membrane protein YedE/YeeE
MFDVFIFLVVILIILFILGFVFDYEIGAQSIFGGLAILYAFRAFMEWKYDKKRKNYILTLVGSIALLVMFIGITLFTFPKEISHTAYCIYVFRGWCD